MINAKALRTYAEGMSSVERDKASKIPDDTMDLFTGQYHKLVDTEFEWFLLQAVDKKAKRYPDLEIDDITVEIASLKGEINGIQTRAIFFEWLSRFGFKPFFRSDLNGILSIFIEF